MDESDRRKLLSQCAVEGSSSQLVAESGNGGKKNNATLLVTYEHDDANGLVAKKKHYIDFEGAETLVQSIEYAYDTRDRLTNISAITPTQQTIMDYDLYYDDQVPSYVNNVQTELVDYTTNWNGNINGTKMNYDFSFDFIANTVNDFDLPTLYGYSYDKINRLTRADATVGDMVQVGVNATASRLIGDANVTYDKIGNIKTMHRTARNTDNTTNAPYTTLQHWNYGYQNGTNRLQYANGLSGTATRAYTYDANGNVLTDNSKNLTETEYGRAAYPFKLKMGTDEEIYLYSTDDQRIYKKSVQGAIVTEDYYLLDVMGKTIALLHTNSTSSTWEFYASGAERECRIKPVDATATITTEEATFFLYDHLGNTRITYTPEEVNGLTGIRINSVVDYFPYGKVLREFYNGQQERYLTTQHERDEATGLDYRGARYYDSDLGRFLSLDPHAKDYASWSAYSYVMGNPISLIDPDGKDPVKPKKKIASYEFTKTVSLYEDDVLTGDEQYSEVTFILTVAKYDDGSVAISPSVESWSVTGVGTEASLTVDSDGIVQGSITYSEGSSTVSKSSTYGGNLNLKAPGTDIGASVSGSTTSSKGTTLSGANVTIGFTMIYVAEKNSFSVTNKITSKEETSVANVLENASTFPADGLGADYYDNQELYIEQSPLVKKRTDK